MSNNTKVSGWKKAYLVLRWPVVLGLLGFSVLFFLVGLLNSLGYNGTTELRAISKESTEWQNFLAAFSSPEDPHRGAPFAWKNNKPEEKDSTTMKFDKRLVRVFEYLKNASGKDPQVCGWSGQHELLTLDIDYQSQWSIYAVPEGKATPLSTIYRGVGARISQADYIKCTQYPKDPSAPQKCVAAPEPTRFPPGNSSGFPIPLSSDDTLKPDAWSYDEANCRVTCAVDYYPVMVDPTDQKPTYNSDIVKLVGFNPKTTTFEYADIAAMSKKAGLLKSTLLAYELMHIDDKGCESAGGNTGYNRAIVISLIMQNYVKDGLGTGWEELVAMAEQKFPFGFQRSSKLAALASDPVLNVLGVHLNF